jgi:hypothetical protein
LKLVEKPVGADTLTSTQALVLACIQDGFELPVFNI